MEPGHDLVYRKLAKLAECLVELESFRGITLEDYVADLRTKRAAERVLQIIVDTATSINAIIIASQGHPPPADYYGTFMKACDLRLIPRALADRLAASTGLRNRLVHEYDKVDDAIVHASIGRALEDYGEFVRSIAEFLDRKPGNDG